MKWCFDTDVISAVLRARPPLHLVRRLARTPSVDQATTSISFGELLYGARKKGSPALERRVRDAILGALEIIPFDEAAAEAYGPLRAELERIGRPLDEPDLRIASIAKSRALVLVTGNVRHFERVPNLEVENWLAEH